MKRKLKMPKLFKFRRKKLRATAVRRPLRFAAAAASYEEMSEPNMKLSRALLIVLLLHVVAVAGIIAFNAIKTRQGTVPSTVAASSPVKLIETTAAAATATPAIKRALPVANLTEGSHKTYVVAKGDNPATIAKKFKVPYDDLLALNHIDDPRKLRVGQKLLIPARTEKVKKAGE